MRRDQRGVALVFGIAVAGEDRRDDMIRRGPLRQTRDDGGVEAAAQADDKSRAPLDDSSRRIQPIICSVDNYETAILSRRVMMG